MIAEQSAPRHCVIASCVHYAAQGSVVCWTHRKTRTGRKWNAIVRQAVQEAGHAVEEGDDSPAAERFRRRLERGDYRGLFDAPLARILAQAVAHEHLDDELGAVRFALARLLAEEPDPRHLALGVSRLVRTSVVTTRERRELHQKQPDPLTEAMTRILAELDEAEAAKDGHPSEPSIVPLAYRDDEAS